MTGTCSKRNVHLHEVQGKEREFIMYNWLFSNQRVK